MSLVVTDTNWAVHEFADADLGDERRTTRLVELAYALGQHPTAALPEACGDGSMLKAAYRFFDNDGIAPQDILQSHGEATSTRLGAVPVVLAVQDTTAVNWTRHPATQGVGPLGHTACHGLLVHTTLAITPERVPLGLLAQQVWARDPADVGKRARRKQLPISQKESQKWLHSLDAVYTAHDCYPTTRLVSVGDREADVYDVLAAPRPAGVDLLIRAAWDRCVQGAERYVWATVTAQPVGAHLQLKVPHRGPPADVTPIEWLLLTTVAVDTVDDATQCVQWYSCRWGIEVWHRILKSGCRIEARQLASGERLQRCLTLYSVIAWRIFYATMLARAVPDMPCSVLLDLDEWRALYCAIHQCPTPPAAPPSLEQAIRWIAQLGGFVGRRRRDQPGTETLWRGFQHLMDLTKMYRIMR